MLKKQGAFYGRDVEGRGYMENSVHAHKDRVRDRHRSRWGTGNVERRNWGTRTRGESSIF